MVGFDAKLEEKDAQLAEFDKLVEALRGESAPFSGSVRTTRVVGSMLPLVPNRSLTIEQCFW